MTSRPDPRLPAHDRASADRYLDSGAWSREVTIARFRAAVAVHGEREAVVGVDGTMTYDELDVRSDQIAAWLITAGIRPGGAVVVQAGNSVETVVAFYSLMKAGAVPVAALPAHRLHEIVPISAIVGAAGHLVDTSVAAGALVDVARANAAAHPTVEHLLTVGTAPEGFVRLADVGYGTPPADARSMVDAVQAALHHEHVAVFQLSGGTTGTPKVIPRLHAEYWNNALINSRALRRTPQSRTAHVMPVLHNAGVVNALFGAHSVGGCLVAFPFTDADELVPRLAEARVTDLMIASAMESWLDHPDWPRLARSLEFLIWSGSKPTPSVLDRLETQGIWTGQTWGMAEGPYASTPRSSPPELRSTAVGTPVFVSDDRMLVVDPDTRVPLEAGASGLLAFTGPSTLAGYYGAPDHDRVAFTADGLLLTGDLARLVEHDGAAYIVLEGRIKDVISRGGEKFSTEEVEKLLRQHPAIAEAAVVAMPDRRLGERSCAYVALTGSADGLDLQDVQHHFAALGVARFKWPERLEILPALPRTPTFKIDKMTLRRRIAEQVGG